MINTKPLIKFLLWTFTLFLICIIGASNVLAYTYEDIGYLSNNATVQVEVDYNPQPLTLAKDREFYLTEVRQLNVFVSNVSMQANNTYQIELQLPNQKLTHANSFEVINYTQNGNETCTNMDGTTYAGEYPKFYFKCNSNITSFYLRIYNSSNNYITDDGQFRWNYVYARKRLGNNNQNQDIIDNQNQNTQDIINNQNSNTQDIIDSIDDNLKTCRMSKNLINKNNLTIGYIDSTTGQLYSGGGSSYTTNIIELENGTYTVSNAHIEKICFYNNDDLFSSCINPSQSSSSLQYTFTLSNYNKIRIQFRNSDLGDLMLNKGSTALDYEPYGEEICTNKLDEQTNAINNLDDTLKDDSVDENGVADAFESFNDYLDDNSTITQLITLPITLYTAILNNLNGTCSPFNLGKLYGEDLILPCINISQYLGNSLWTMIDIIISGFAVYAISKKMIKVFNNFSSLREGDVIDD